MRVDIDIKTALQTMTKADLNALLDDAKEELAVRWCMFQQFFLTEHEKTLSKTLQIVEVKKRLQTTLVIAKELVEDYTAEQANQCDGCRRGQPIVNGIHRTPGSDPWDGDSMACTRNRYVK